MPLLDWDAAFSVGIKAMDSEHRKLIDVINRLYDAMKAGKSKDVMDSVFKDLIEYTKVHFTDEEELMKKNNFPGLSEQITQHRQLEKKVVEEFDKYKNGALLISIEMMGFLKDWLMNHIMQFDKKYGQFLNEKGIF